MLLRQPERQQSVEVCRESICCKGSFVEERTLGKKLESSKIISSLGTVCKPGNGLFHGRIIHIASKPLSLPQKYTFFSCHFLILSCVSPSWERLIYSPAPETRHILSSIWLKQILLSHNLPRQTTNHTTTIAKQNQQNRMIGPSAVSSLTYT